MNRRLALLALSAIAATLVGCATATVADAAASAPKLTTFNRLISDAGLNDTLRGAGPYTLLAPSDEAFAALPAAQLAALSADKEQLKRVISYHVLPGRYDSSAVVNGNVKTLQGSELEMSKSGSFVTVEDAMVTQADLSAGNGVVHVIDRVLMPPKR
jgi:uncharacterized surface protein with fasciclin (FAS1) repeats